MQEETNISNQPGTELTAPPLIIKLGKPRFIPKYQSSIPQSITNEILSREKLPEPLPALGSSIIEDFLVEKINHGVVQNSALVEQFFLEGIPDKITEFLSQVRTKSNQLNWKEVFDDSEFPVVKDRIVSEMRAMGMPKEQIEALDELISVELREGVGISSVGKGIAFANRLQCVRKAMDYVRVFGNEQDLPKVVRVMILGTLGHELGHKVDEVSGNAINKIPHEWRNVNGETVDYKADRFAEYWADVGIGLDPELLEIKRREWLIHLKKVTLLWEAINSVNGKLESDESKIDLFAIFRGIDDRLKPDDQDTKALLHARRILYGGNEVESYASPYSRDVITKAVMESRDKN